MAKKYRFRKIFFQCSNKQVIAPEYQMVNAFQYRDYAERQLAERQRNGMRFEWEAKDYEPPVMTVEGFYLVPEALYDEILKPFVKD